MEESRTKPRGAHNDVPPKTDTPDSDDVPKEFLEPAQSPSDFAMKNRANSRHPGYLSEKSASDELPENRTEKEMELQDLREALNKQTNYIHQLEKQHRGNIDSLKREISVERACFDDQLEEMQFKMSQMSEIDQNQHLECQKIVEEKSESLRKLKAECQKLTSERITLEAKFNATIRKQQEYSFSQMESGRWLPIEDTKVTAQLDRIKRSIRRWAKSVSIQDISVIHNLGEVELDALMETLSGISVLENNQIPSGLSTTNSGALLLNALLAHDVFTTMFRSPFFFFRSKEEFQGQGMKVEAALNEIYYYSQASNQQDAHAWRSQTLRLLLPPLRRDSSKGETSLRGRIQKMLACVAKQHALAFTSSPAQQLMSRDKVVDSSQKLRAIYQDAATLSYQLWTRKITMKCFTLHELSGWKFDSDSHEQTPHSLVRYDDHQDLLKGRPITVLVHPLLKAYGTDEGKEYDMERVWAPAEVWLDSKV